MELGNVMETAQKFLRVEFLAGIIGMIALSSTVTRAGRNLFFS